MSQQPQHSLLRDLAPVDRARLAQQIAAAALLRGSFTLRSGRTSSYYLDKYLFSTKPAVLAQVAELFAQRIDLIQQQTRTRADRLAGAELGGIPLVTAASLRTGLPSIFIRNSKKDYGTSKQLEGELHPADAVILLEDVATTAGQALEAVKVLQSQGANVLAVIAAIDRLEGARENCNAAGVRFESLLTKHDLGVTD